MPSDPLPSSRPCSNRCAPVTCLMRSDRVWLTLPYGMRVKYQGRILTGEELDEIVMNNAGADYE